MSSYYEELEWEINVELDVDPEFVSVSIEYQYANYSEENCYYAILPKFQSIPYRSLVDEKKVLVGAKIVDENKIEKLLFITEREVKGIADSQSDCLMPIPWPSSEGFILPGNLLKLRFNWIEQKPTISTIEGGLKRWSLDHSIPLSKLFIPFELNHTNAAMINSYRNITWKINFPEGTSITGDPTFNYKPLQKRLNQNISRDPSQKPIITLSIPPNILKPFADNKLCLQVNLAVPIELQSELYKTALKKIQEYTSEVIVAVVDLRGSSDKAEQQRNQVNPAEYTLRFHRLIKEMFPHSLYSKNSEDPLNFRMKKVIGDMLMLVAPVSKSIELANAILIFLKKLRKEGLPYRAGFHVDQATDTGHFINSSNEIGTDFLGPALNWAAKIGDDKKNVGIRVTKPAADRIIPLIDKNYDLIIADPLEKKPDLQIFDLIEKSQDFNIHNPMKIIPFSDRLNQRILELNSRVCVGLDPDLTHFPNLLLNKYNLTDYANTDFDKLSLQDVAACIINFNKIVIDAVCDNAVAVKPQSAHYERFGHYGIQALEETAKYAKEKGLIIILDAKRNDIGSTAEKYALAYLGSDFGNTAAAISFDALTVNPYLGIDGIKPFVEFCNKNGKGIFVLVKTSNVSSGDLQDLKIVGDNELLSHRVASMVNDCGKEIINGQGYSSVGAVVGATYPEDIVALRKKMPKSIFLMPGYGAQGAKAENITSAFDEKGLGAIVNSSRGIIYCYPPDTTNFQNKITEQLIYMKDDLNRLIK